MSSAINKVGEWNVWLVADDDGHLTVTVENADGSKVIQIEEDVTANDTEWGDRFTTEKIESDYREEMRR